MLNCFFVCLFFCFFVFMREHRYHFLNQDNSGVIWLVSGLQHMAKMLAWTPHSLGVQNIQLVIDWVTKQSSSTLPKLLPPEFVESLRASVKQRPRSPIEAKNLTATQNTLKTLGIQLSDTDFELLR